MTGFSFVNDKTVKYAEYKRKREPVNNKKKK